VSLCLCVKCCLYLFAAAQAAQVLDCKLIHQLQSCLNQCSRICYFTNFFWISQNMTFYVFLLCVIYFLEQWFEQFCYTANCLHNMCCTVTVCLSVRWLLWTGQQYSKSRYAQNWPERIHSLLEIPEQGKSLDYQFKQAKELTSCITN